MIHAFLLALAVQGCSEPGFVRGLGGTESGWSPHQRMHLRHILDTKMIGLVHDDHRRLARNS